MNEPLPFIPVAAPWITEREGDLAKQAALTAWGPDHYAFNRQFEEQFATYVGRRFAVSLPHATAALHLALAAHDIGPGDEVIVPDVTWIASTAPITYVGAQPVFVDILPDTWCIDPDAVRGAITPATKAIIGVDLYGSMCEWQDLSKIAEDHGLILIEDAAEALGSRYRSAPAGSFGRAAAFSFHGSKTLVTGEGGMLVCDDPELHARIQSLRDHGRPAGDRFFQNNEVAFKYKMSAMQAAVGLAQMERLDEMVAKKRQIFGWYQERLGGRNDLQLNAEPTDVVNSYWMTTIVPLGKTFGNKFELQAALRGQNIDSRPFFSRLSEIAAYKDDRFASQHLPEKTKGDRAATHGINLPSGYSLREADIDRICNALNAIGAESQTTG